MEHLRVFTTGGTIDKIYFDRLSEFQVGEPQIDALLREANVSFTWRITELMRKDSLEMDAADRARIRAAVAADSAERVLVTHGTDTMLTTAMALEGMADKTVVLTGAMQPAMARESDAVFNIGFAIGVLATGPCGVYVAMNGRVFRPREARKNRTLNRFESTRDGGAG